MNTVFSASMRKATQLTRGQNVIEATRVIQRAPSWDEVTPNRRANSRPKARADRAESELCWEFRRVRAAPARR